MRHLLFLASLLLFNSAHGAGNQTMPVSATRGAELENMLVQDCGSCHGLKFRGGLGPALLPDNLQGKSRDFLIVTILEGRAGTAMPPWKKLLTEEEAAWMADRLLDGSNMGDGS
jgi:cytochrome c55X